MDMQKDRGGRIAANFRSANIAEGLAIQMLRPFAAVAPVPREEDYGIDLIGTLIRKSGRVYAAEDSFAVQIKTHTSANFHFSGEGLRWLRELDLPYFPVVVDLGNATISLFSLNRHRYAYIRNSAVLEINFTIDGDGMDDFPLGDPLLTWTLEEAAHPEFSAWAYSVLKPAIKIESWNQRYAPAQSIRALEYETQLFRNRQSDGTADLVPSGGKILHIPPGDGQFIQDTILRVLEPFTGWISNTGNHNHLGLELLNIRSAFRRFGLDPDPADSWDQIVSTMDEYAAKQKPNA
ncbi:hypothetical protein [Pseudomonas umsongensis]